MARKFVTQREVDFIDLITKELTQNVVGTYVDYYAISLEHTRVHELYGEAIEKVWSPPVRVNALVLYDNPSEVANRFSLDQRFNVEVYFHVRELRDRNVSVRTGDFVRHGRVFYEIASSTQPQLIYGQVNNKVMTKCVCVPARADQFSGGGWDAIDDERAENVENAPGLPPADPLVTGSLGQFATNRLAYLK